MRNAPGWIRPLLFVAFSLPGALWAGDGSIESLEREVGTSSPQLIDPLVGLADALIARQQVAAAIEPLRRAINIVRRNSGLYDPRQYDLLLRVIDAQSLTGDFAAAAADLTYLQRVSESSYGIDSLQYGRALADVAHWQCRIGQFMQGRETFRRSVTLLEANAAKDPLVESLRRFAQCCLQELAGVGVATSSDSLDFYRGPIVRSQQFSPSNPAFRSHVLQYLRMDGEQALQRAVEVSAALDPKLHLEVLLQTGDWFLAKDYIREARRFYARAETLARAAGAEDTLLVPAQVLYALPASALRTRHLAVDDTEESFVEVEFTVRGDGKIVNEKVIDHGPGRSATVETLAALQAARFRPRMVGGRTQMTDGVRFRQSFRQRK
jgi:tetratricopeptide (TPR) repeat protein